MLFTGVHFIICNSIVLSENNFAYGLVYSHYTSCFPFETSTLTALGKLFKIICAQEVWPFRQLDDSPECPDLGDQQELQWPRLSSQKDSSTVTSIWTIVLKLEWCVGPSPNVTDVNTRFVLENLHQARKTIPFAIDKFEGLKMIKLKRHLARNGKVQRKSLE